MNGNDARLIAIYELLRTHNELYQLLKLWRIMIFYHYSLHATTEHFSIVGPLCAQIAVDPTSTEEQLVFAPLATASKHARTARHTSTHAHAHACTHAPVQTRVLRVHRHSYK